MSATKVVLGVLTGIAVGALVGVLLAPDKGSETRKKISKKGSDSMDNMKDKFEKLLNTLAKKFGDTKECMQKLYEKGKKQPEDLEANLQTA